MSDSNRLLDQLSHLKPFHRRDGRQILVAIPQLGLLKVVAGTLRGNGEAVTETADLPGLLALIDAARQRRVRETEARPFQVVLLDARGPDGAEAAAALRASDRGLRLLAIVEDALSSRAALHGLGAFTLVLPLRSRLLLAAVAATAIPRSVSAANASEYGFGMPDPEETRDTVPSWFPEYDTAPGNV